jgi:hypothetical protein
MEMRQINGRIKGESRASDGMTRFSSFRLFNTAASRVDMVRLIDRKSVGGRPKKPQDGSQRYRLEQGRTWGATCAALRVGLNN